MKKQWLAFLMGSLTLSAVHASYPQNINFCLTVKGNTSPYTFEGRFYSSDFFDHGTYVHGLNYGTQCVFHNYGHGPKNISLSVKTTGPMTDMLLVPNPSCSYMYNYKGTPGWLVSDYQGTNTPSVSWALTLTQGPPIGMYKYVFYMDCQRFAEPGMM